MSNHLSNEFDSFSDLEKELASLNFSAMSRKNRVYEETQKRLSTTHKNANTNTNRQKRLLTWAASFMVMCLLVTQTTYATEFIDYMIKLVMLGDSKVIQVERPKEITEDDFIQASKSYSENTSSVINTDVVVYNQSSDLVGKTDFELKMPEYLPEGYAFNRGEFYKQEDGSISNDYVSLYYVNARTHEEIIMQGRATNADTDYVAITDGKVTEVLIHGVKAALINESSIQWSEENAAYHLSSKGNIGREELIKIAESIR